MAAAAATKKEPELNIYQRINAISQEAGALAPEAKGGVPFAFRGIDGTINHLTPFLHKYGVFLVPVIESHVVIPTPTGNRTVKTSEVEVSYEVFGPEGKSDIVVKVPGLADDFADRSTAQAMSVAYRIALLQLFHLPTNSPDPEETGQQVVNEAGKAPAAPKAVAKANEQAAGGGTTAPANALGKLQAKAKALGRTLDKSSDQLNALGVATAAEGVTDWYNDATSMAKLVAKLEAEAEAKAKAAGKA